MRTFDGGSVKLSVLGHPDYKLRNSHHIRVDKSVIGERLNTHETSASRVAAPTEVFDLPARLADLTVLCLREGHALRRPEQIGECVRVLSGLVVLADVLYLVRGQLVRLQSVWACNGSVDVVFKTTITRL